MKKLIIILFLFGGTVLAQSPLVITGVSKSCQTRSSLIGELSGWLGAIYSFGSTIYYVQSPTTAVILADRDFLLTYQCKRIGLIFDISALPNGVVVDSVKLELYNIGSSTSIGATIYSGNYLVCGASSGDGDYGACTYSQSRNITSLSTLTSLESGYNSFNLGTALPPSYYYVGDYACYGVIEYEHDKLETPPTSSNEVEFNVNAASNNPKLTIYYHSIPTPSPRKIKIIGII